MSGPTISPHIVVAGTRRSWRREEKRVILDEAESTTASVSSVARRRGLNPLAPLPLEPASAGAQAA